MLFNAAAAMFFTASAQRFSQAGWSHLAPHHCFVSARPEFAFRCVSYHSSMRVNISTL